MLNADTHIKSMYSYTYFTKALDPAQRVFELLDKAEPRIARRFLRMVKNIKEQATLTKIADLLETGRVEEALTVTRSGALAAEVNAAFVAAGMDTAEELTKLMGSMVDFDAVNQRAVDIMRNNQFRLVSEFTRTQRDATQEALVEGILKGAGPREQARAFRDSIGLTSRQEQAVANYRRLLENLDAEALRRELRDRRFDGTVRRAITNDSPLTAAQIDRMVERYRERYLKYRAEVIARTEALRAVHEGIEEMYRQAIDDGTLDPDGLTRMWNTAKDPRVRDTHGPMQGQKRPFGVPFVSGGGALLRYPGDPAASAAETIQCRCAISTRIQ